MKQITNFCKNNMLVLLFLFGAIGIYAGYYFCFNALSVQWARFWCSVFAFISEFALLIYLSSFAKTVGMFAKLLLLNLVIVSGLILICAFLSVQYVSTVVIPFIIMIGIISFLFSWVVFAAIIKYKKLL